MAIIEGRILINTWSLASLKTRVPRTFSDIFHLDCVLAMFLARLMKTALLFFFFAEFISPSLAGPTTFKRSTPSARVRKTRLHRFQSTQLSRTSDRPDVKLATTAKPVTDLNGTALPAYDTIYYFDQLIDHSNPSLGTFKQRYWHTWEWYKPGKYNHCYNRILVRVNCNNRWPYHPIHCGRRQLGTWVRFCQFEVGYHIWNNYWAHSW